MILDLMLLCDDLYNLDTKYTYKKNIRNLWVKSSLFSPQIGCQLYHCDTNIEYTDQPKGEMEYLEDDILFFIRGGSNESEQQETTNYWSD